jgi:quinol monooxygenase YgiN
LSFHFIVRFEPRPGKEPAFREELLRVNAPSRAEPGCLRIDVYESLRESFVFAIHSEWVDEASFELHAILPHTVQFLEVAETLPTRLRRLRGSGCAKSELRQRPRAKGKLSGGVQDVHDQALVQR